MIDAGGGDDTINLATGQFVAGEQIQGGADSGSGTRDQIVLTAATTVDLTLGTVSGIETLTGSGGNDTVTMSAALWSGFSTINLGAGTDVLNVVAGGDISALGTPAVGTVETGNLTGTAGTDTVTLSGAQLDAIVIGAGTINLGAGAGDTINLTSTSADLNTLGATNASIAGVEAISAASAATGVTITLTGQTEAFAITGSAPGRHHHRRPPLPTRSLPAAVTTRSTWRRASSLPASRSRAAPTAAAAPATRSC